MQTFVRPSMRFFQSGVSIQSLVWSLTLVLGFTLGLNVQAGKYGQQSFTFPNGTVPGQGAWNDGTSLTSTLIGDPPAPSAFVRSNMLHLVSDGVTNTAATLKLPDLDPDQDISGFNFSFNLRMQGTGSIGRGLSVNFGDIPDTVGDGELGFSLTGGLTVGFRTFADATQGETNGAVSIYVNRVKLAEVNHDFIFDGSAKKYTITLNATGLHIQEASTMILELPALNGFVAHIGDRFAISARTGDDLTQDINVDDLLVTTTPTASINTGGFIISEFVANNQNSYEDDDLQRSDWIEIYNGGVTSNLFGWFLTNEKTNKTKWVFPSMVVASNQYRIVFASGKNRTLTNASLHANFTLQKEGGYLALIRPDLTIASEYEYPAQKADVAYGEIGAQRVRGYLETPTPTKKNISLVADGPPLEGVQFSSSGGLLVDSKPVVLSIAPPTTAGAVIRYTLDNTVPTANSPIYSQPFVITNSTTVRARVTASGRLPGKVTSCTYLKMDNSLLNYAGTGKPFSSSLPVLVFDSFGSDVDSTTDPGAPRPFKLGYAVAIETDPVTGHSSLTNAPNFAGRSGFHVRGESSSGFGQKSYAWELWNESNDDQSDSILGMPAESDWALHGPWSDLTMMRNYLIYSTMRDVHSDYLATRSRFVEVFFNQEKNQPVSASDYRGVYLLVEKIKQSKDRVNVAKINSLVTDSNLITGGYIFKTDKASLGSTAWSTTGHGISMQSHDPETFSPVQLKSLQAYITSFEKALDSSSFGDPILGYQAWIDVPVFIDCQWWLEIAKQVDGYVFSTYYHKDRGGKIRTGPLWDFNIALGNANYGTGDTPTGWLYNNSPSDPLAGGLWYPRLHQDPEYRLKHWDRYWEIRNSVWSTAAIMARIDATVNLLLDGSSAAISNNTPVSVQNPVARQYRKYQILAAGQWPNPDGFAQRKTFQSEISYMKTWLSNRLSWIDDQNLGGISVLRPPVFSKNGGLVSDGYALEMAPYSGVAPVGKRYPGGTIYYTLDGSDPRPPAYGVPTAKELVLIPEFHQASYFVPTANNGGPLVAFSDWTAPDLGPTAASLSWSTGTLGLGFDDPSSTNYFYIGGGNVAAGDIRSAMQGKSSTVFIRVPFTLTADQAQQASSLKLKMRSDDAFVAYLNGVQVARFNIKATNNPSWDTFANNLPKTWTDASSVLQKDYVLTNGVATLRAGTNVLAILGINASVDDDDALFSPILSGTFLQPPNTPVTSQPYTGPISIHGTTTVKARLYSGGFWTPIHTETFSVGVAPASADTLVISEIMYNPASPTVAESKVSSNASDYEYLEFLNTSDLPIDLSSVKITSGVLFDFATADPSLLTLPGHGRIIVCANAAAFHARYGNADTSIHIAGTFTDSLSNSGETLTVVGRGGAILLSFTYGDKAPWPTAADGTGYSLVLNTPFDKPAVNPALGANWHASYGLNGNPGHSDGPDFTLDPSGDLDGDGLPNYLEYAMGSSPSTPATASAVQIDVRPYTVGGVSKLYTTFEFRRSLFAEGTILELQASADLKDWNAAGQSLVLVGSRNNGDGSATVTYRASIPTTAGNSGALFVRLMAR